MYPTGDLISQGLLQVWDSMTNAKISSYFMKRGFHHHIVLSLYLPYSQISIFFTASCFWLATTMAIVFEVGTFLKYLPLVYCFPIAKITECAAWEKGISVASLCTKHQFWILARLIDGNVCHSSIGRPCWNKNVLGEKSTFVLGVSDLNIFP